MPGSLVVVEDSISDVPVVRDKGWHSREVYVHSQVGAHCQGDVLVQVPAQCAQAEGDAPEV